MNSITTAISFPKMSLNFLTSSFPANLFLFVAMYILPPISQAKERFVFTFDKESPRDEWQIVNDGVMGGLSKSRFEISNGHGLFSGKVSLENNGGFASVRSLPRDLNLDGCAKIILRIYGDGKRYKFTIRTSKNYDGVNYQLPFVTKKDQWQEIELPLEKFIPTWRGRILSDEPPISASSIQSLGLLISDKQKGEFAIKIDWIKAR